MTPPFFLGVYSHPEGILKKKTTAAVAATKDTDWRTKPFVGFKRMKHDCGNQPSNGWGTPQRKRKNESDQVDGNTPSKNSKPSEDNGETSSSSVSSSRKYDARERTPNSMSTADVSRAAAGAPLFFCCRRCRRTSRTRRRSRRRRRRRRRRENADAGRGRGHDGRMGTAAGQPGHPDPEVGGLRAS